jgi:hypothetical protein
MRALRPGACYHTARLGNISNLAISALFREYVAMRPSSPVPFQPFIRYSVNALLITIIYIIDPSALGAHRRHSLLFVVGSGKSFGCPAMAACVQHRQRGK